MKFPNLFKAWTSRFCMIVVRTPQCGVYFSVKIERMCCVGTDISSKIIFMENMWNPLIHIIIFKLPKLLEKAKVFTENNTVRFKANQNALRKRLMFVCEGNRTSQLYCNQELPSHGNIRGRTRLRATNRNINRKKYKTN